MNKQNIVEKYNISQPKFDEILDDLNISQDTILFSDDQVALFERIFHLARQQKKGYKKAISIVLNQSANSLEHSEPSSVLDPKLTDFFHQKSATFAEQMIDETPHLSMNSGRLLVKSLLILFGNGSMRLEILKSLNANLTLSFMEMTSLMLLFCRGSRLRCQRVPPPILNGFLSRA